VRELVVSLTKQSQGTSLLMELGGLVRHVCIDGIEYLRRHGDHQGEVWMVQFFFSPKHLEEFIVLDEPRPGRSPICSSGRFPKTRSLSC
jgi:hypothetical protein